MFIFLTSVSINFVAKILLFFIASKKKPEKSSAIQKKTVTLALPKFLDGPSETSFEFFVSEMKRKMNFSFAFLSTFRNFVAQNLKENMAKKKSKLSRRITWRVILIVTLINMLIMGVVYLFNLITVEMEGEMRSQHIMDGIEGKMTVMLRAVEITAANNLAEFETSLDSPEQVYGAMEHELRLNSHYLGCGMGFVPDYYASQGRWFEPYVIMTDSTHVERKQIGSAEHDYHHQEWYQKGIGLEKGKGYLTDPYYDKDGGECMMATYVSPVFDRQGHPVAVYGIDIDLSWLDKSLLDEETRIKKQDLAESDPDDPDDYNALFIQLLDSRGKKIAGSETLDDQTIETILKEDSIYWEKAKVNDMPYFICSKRLANTGWTIVVGQHRDFVYIFGYILGLEILVLMTIGGLIIFFFLNRSIRRAVKPLSALSDSAQKVAHGNFDTPLPAFKHQDEVAQLRDSFATMQQSLKQYVEELKTSTAAKASMESELNIAHSIQMSMLPKTFPAFPDRHDIELYAQQKPAKAVGGDLYDFFIRDEKLFFCIGDVSGKGVPASLVMAVTRTLFRNVANHVEAPHHIVASMNTAISEGNDNNMFVTLFVGVLDLQTGHLHYCNAGHDAPYVIGGKGIVASETDAAYTLVNCDSNLPIGIMPDWRYTLQVTQMAPDSIIFLYTDGLTEAENAQHVLFGDDRIAAVLSTFKGAPQQLIDTMTGAVHHFVGDTEQSDDLTMLAIQYTSCS